MTSPDKPIPILVKPRPISGESARGYVMRCGELNGWETARWFLSFLKAHGVKSKGHAALADVLGESEMLLSCLRGPISNLVQLNAPDPGGLPIRYWNSRQPRFCPACLEDSSYWRASWDLVFMTACDQHGFRMADRCPACEKPLAWNRPHVAACQCGFDLRKTVPVKATANAIWMAREISQRLHPNPSRLDDGLEVLRPIGLEALLKLVWFLGAYSRNAHRKPQKVIGLETVTVATAMLEPAATILSDWPVGFHGLLDQIVARQGQSVSGNKLGGKFGGFYGALYKSFPGPEFEFLRQGFEHYLREHWEGQLARRNKRLSSELKAEHEWVSIAEAAKLLNMRTDRIRDFIESGLLEGNLHETTGGRRMSAIRRDSLDAMIVRRRDWVNLKEARTLLGISRKRAYALLAQGVLKPISGPTVDGQTLWGFSQQYLLSLDCPKTM